MSESVKEPEPPQRPSIGIGEILFIIAVVALISLAISNCAMAMLSITNVEIKVNVEPTKKAEGSI